MNNRVKRLCKCCGNDQDTGAFGHVTSPAESDGNIAAADRYYKMGILRHYICGTLKVNLEPGVAPNESAGEETRELKRHVERVDLAIESELINRALQSG